LPFALELFALYHLLAGILGYRSDWTYLRLGADKDIDPADAEGRNG
jgi:hypothetical protein